MPIHIFVPRWMNRTNTNAQNLNAKAMLSRFADPRARWTAMCSDEPESSIVKNGVRTVALSKSRWWEVDLALSYQSKFDAIFYPGSHWPDEVGLRVRRLWRRPIPVIATLEGMIADASAIQRLSHLVGHPVFSQPGVEHAIPRLRRMYAMADHIIAISPFLSRAAKFLYGDKVSHLPLGLESGIFHCLGRREPPRCRVVSCGTIKNSKNPQLFLQLAARYQQADFVWFGDGEMRQTLLAEAKQTGLDNLAFPGALPRDSLAEEFRNSSIFVLPSHAEGVPKVTQEAAACGLPVVLNGFYEAPTVIHEHNGLVAWSDEEIAGHMGALIDDPGRCRRMGLQGAEMAKEWDWNLVAPRWEELVIRLATSPASHR
jgi:glycosyltransferase involved in cell wall biosynthesis